ncbi:DUF4249 domain-containing protein [Spirosoma soli]|uniref:DUF4249 domain-containing protein n=1 Tax=Spirosoma soli TaxID=1770529 RepID=A0ABW5MAP4_9BACT
MFRSLYTQLSLWIVGLVLLTSCDSLRQEVNPDRLNRESAKLVVTCFLSPQDTVLAVKVSRSQPVLGEETGGLYTGNTVANATVTISQGGQSVQLPFVSSQAYYKIDAKQLPVLAGQTYTLTVQTPNGEQATSRCIIPEPVVMTSVTFDSIADNQFGQRRTRYFVRARWDDPANQVNYYQLTGLFQAIQNCLGCERSPTYKEQVLYNNLYFRDNSNGLLTDRTTNGGPMISDRGFLGGGYTFFNGQQVGFTSQYKTASVQANLLNTDQAYYLYQDAIARQSEVSGNPFAEPVPVPTNLTGALGCFAGYNRSTITLKIK